MNIKIKLKNKKYCNGCYLATGCQALDGQCGRFLGEVCQLGYWTKQIKRCTCESYLNNLFTYVHDKTGKKWDSEKDPYMLETKTLINRPKRCIEENGI